jgi:hypothetical protein
MTNVSLDNAKYTFDQLEDQYNGFRVPAIRLKVGGSDVTLAEGMVVSTLTLETTTTQEADVLRFSVADSYDPVKREFLWLDKVLALGKEIEAHLGYGDKLHPVFFGYITAVGVHYSNEGSVEVQVTAMDPSFKLMRGREFKSFRGKKVSDIVREIANSYGLSCEIDATNDVIPVLFRKPESDFQFLHELALSVNYEFFVVGKKLYFRQKGANQNPFSTLRLGTHLMKVSIEHNLSEQITQVRVRSWDPLDQKTIEARSTQVNRIGDNKKTGPALLKALSGELEEVLFVNGYDKLRAQCLADAVLNEHALRLVSGEAECIGLPEIRSGRYFKLEGLGKNLDNIYYIDRATHVIDDTGYVTNFTFQGNAV